MGLHSNELTLAYRIARRRAFPCFDEPSYKVQWQLTLEVPKDQQAFSNTPVIAETASGNTKTLRFGKTRPSPSYLVTFAVGPHGGSRVRGPGYAGRRTDGPEAPYNRPQRQMTGGFTTSPHAQISLSVVIRLFVLLVFSAAANTIAQIRCNGCDMIAPPDHINYPAKRDAAKVPEAILKVDHERSLKEADELMKLAAAVQATFHNSDRHLLDVSTVKNLDEIERIVKRIRKRLRRM